MEFVILLSLTRFVYSKKDIDENEDKYYLIFIDNPNGEIPITTTSKNQCYKRQESSELIENLVNEIHSLIINNKDTFKNPEKLNEIKEKSTLKKRNINYLVNYGDSDYVHPISSIYNSTVLKAYLSKTLVEKVKKL
eukprot:jgi/Orpsp1_1/1182162/evm.model.c7180000080126.1